MAGERGDDGAGLRARLVEELRRSGALRDDRIAAAFLDVPRERFVPEFAAREGLAAVYRNELIVTKTDARGIPLSSSSEPQVMAAMLQGLDVREGMHVLELGVGTGYNAALLRRLVGPSGRVTAIELDPDLARRAARALREGGFDVRVLVGDAHDGVPEHAPYDRIVAGASSAAVPVAWRDQLVDGGRLELPLRLSAAGAQAIATFRRNGARLESVAVVPGRFMPLRGEAAGTVLPATLTVLQSLEAGRPPVLTQLAGSGIARLSDPSRRRLLRLADVRARRLGIRFPAWSLGLYLALEVPARSQVTRFADLATGIVGAGGRSLALVPGRWAGGDRPTAQRVLAYGGTAAEERLDALLDEWRHRGRPGRRELRVEVEFRGGRSRIAHTWERGRAAAVVPTPLRP